MSKAQTTSARSPTAGYKVTFLSKADSDHVLKRVIPPKRGPTSSVPGVTLAESLLIADAMVNKFELKLMDGMVTAEMAKRPIPHVNPIGDTAKLCELFVDWLPDLYNEFILPQLVPPWQTFNRVSKTGWPGFHRPDDKLAYVMQFAPSVLAGDLSFFDNAYIYQNVRLQPTDNRGKSREYQFVDPLLGVYTEFTTEDSRSVRTPLGIRCAMRTRLVFNFPIYNLIKQALDTAIHNVFLKHPAFHHDMSNGRLLPVRGYHYCMDVKHFERHTASCVRARAEFLGGVYAKCGAVSNKIPFAVPTDDWKQAVMLHVDRQNGYSEQFGSGDSAVSPAQKEILMVLYASFAVTHLRMSRKAALHWVAAGGDHRLTIRNYGDDNSVDGDRKVIDDMVAYMSEYLTVERELPEAFLGWQYHADTREWLLGRKSYILRGVYNERAPGTAFRAYSFLGWAEKRKVYARRGEAIIRNEVFPYEDALIAKVGMPWSRVLELAEEDRQAMILAGQDFSNPLIVLEKDYALSAQEKIATGDFQGLVPEVTARWISKLLSPELLKKTKWYS